MPTPFRKNIDGSVIKLLQERSAAWKKGKSSSHWDASVRNPAYITISCAGVTLPRNEKTFGEVYNNFKPGPLLKNVTLTQGGTYGLTQELSAEIQCHTMSDFLTVEDAYGKIHNEVTIHFGYPNKSYAKKGYDYHKQLKGYMIVSYEFNTTSEGYWIYKIKAMAAGDALRDFDLQVGALPKEFTKLQVKIDGENHNVTDFLELLDSHAQGNGQKALDEVDSGTSRFITSQTGGIGSLVLYDITTVNNGGPRFLAGIVGIAEKMTSGHDLLVFYTLEYIVNIINKTLIAKGKEINKTFAASGAEIIFDEDSISYLDPNIVSARPFQVLIMGNGTGNYRNKNGRGIDFEKNAGNNPDLHAVSPGGPDGTHKIDLKKILISQEVIMTAFNMEKGEKGKYEETSVKATKDGGLRLDDFFRQIFSTIDKATGGAIALRLSIPSETLLNGGERMNKLVIYDENNGYYEGPLNCVVFDPINGDGTTRSCSVSSDAGSQTYQGAMYAGTQTSNDSCAPVHKVSDSEEYEEVKTKNQTKREETIEKWKKIMRDPGKLQKSGFSESNQKGLEECNTAFHKTIARKEDLNILAYPGLKLSLELDGIYGFRIGHAIRTMTMSPRFFEANAYFHITEVTHNFNGDTSDWSTQIEAQIALHNNLTNYWL